MRILLLSAYDAASHQRWYRNLQRAFSADQWTVLTLPPRYFNWRIRGNSLSWAFQHRQLLERGYDLLIATSMVDLSALRGFVPALAAIPTLVYFHENQFAYPGSDRQFSSVEPRILNLYTALVADELAFNSVYNRDSFIQGVDQLLLRLPDQVPAGLVQHLRLCSQILPVPLANDCFLPRPATECAELPAALKIVWNHRWEYDKAPERLFAALQLLLEHKVEIQLFMLGQQFRQSPPVIAEMKAWLQQNFPSVIQRWGFLESRAEYQSVLGRADVVVSTALHDFQGLAVLEAVAAGCIPIVPDRLCYGEWFDAGYRYSGDIEQPEREAAALAAMLLELAGRKKYGQLPPAPDISCLSIEKLRAEYGQTFVRLKTLKRDGQRGCEPVS